jgi:hypothetical protein
MCVYIGVGLRRNMPGAMFILSDGRTVDSQHYRLDETRFPCIPSRRPPGVAGYARALPADEPCAAGEAKDRLCMRGVFLIVCAAFCVE